MKKILIILLACIMIFTTGTVCFANEQADGDSGESEAMPADTDLVQLFLDANAATLHMAAYDQSNFFPFWYSWFNLVQFYTYDEIIAAAENPDETMLPLFENLYATYGTIKKIAEPVDIEIDIWEGHDVLPVPGGIEEDTASSINAALHDDDNFRPFMTFAPTEDAVGTILAVPSIRGGMGELTDVAAVFNSLGYNVFMLQPRFDTVEGLKYIDLQLDSQRALRYIIYNAKKFGINPEKIITIGGSKGNQAHQMIYNYFDATPLEVAEAVGKPIEGYECDEIDDVPALAKIILVNYGSHIFGSTGEEVVKNITESKIYSEENAANGIKFPAVYVITGNLDEAGMMKNMAAIVDGFNTYNNMKDKLYPIGFEIHIMDQLYHGRGMALDSANVAALWTECSEFIKMNLK